MSRYKGNGICDICGDKTLCRNFAANACESCKAFFRRAIRDNKTFICPSNGQCVIDKSTRKLCKTCRLNKCIAVGMRREFVRSNEENKIHKQLIAENREKRKSNAHNSVISSPVSSASDVSTHSQQSIEGKDFLNELIDKTVNISDEELSQQILEIEINLSVNENNCSEETNKVQLTPKVQSLPIIPIIRPLDNRNDWNCLETNRIAELLSATKIFDYELPKNTITANDFSDMIIKYHDQMDRDIKDLVRFTKNLNGFANICSADQLSLVKNKCVEICLLREAIYFDNDVDSLYLKINNDNKLAVKLDVFKLIKVPYYSTYRMFIDKFILHCKHDPHVTDLLTAIILFDPKCPQLKHKHIVKLEQQLYIYLLQRYLLLKYGSECESHSYLLNVLKMSTDLNALTEMIRTYAKHEEFKELIPYCGPLTREVYNIDQGAV